MQETNFITQLILEIKMTHYLLSPGACSGVPEHTHLKQPTKGSFAYYVITEGDEGGFW